MSSDRTDGRAPQARSAYPKNLRFRRFVREDIAPLAVAVLLMLIGAGLYVLATVNLMHKIDRSESARERAALLDI